MDTVGAVKVAGACTEHCKVSAAAQAEHSEAAAVQWALRIPGRTYRVLPKRRKLDGSTERERESVQEQVEEGEEEKESKESQGKEVASRALSVSVEKVTEMWLPSSARVQVG